MKTQYRLLGRQRRLWVREIARRSFNDCDGDLDRAVVLAERRIRDAPKSIIGTILIGVAIKLAIASIVHWIQSRVATVPSGEFLKEEPGSE